MLSSIDVPCVLQSAKAGSSMDTSSITSHSKAVREGDLERFVPAPALEMPIFDESLVVQSEPELKSEANRSFQLVERIRPTSRRSESIPSLITRTGHRAT